MVQFGIESDMCEDADALQYRTCKMILEIATFLPLSTSPLQMTNNLSFVTKSTRHLSPPATF